MEIKEVKPRDVYRAAFRAGVGVVSVKPYRTYLHVQLAALGDLFERQMFTSTGPRTARSHNGTKALCWHGYYTFFRHLFQLAPLAEVRTRLPDKSSQRYNARNFSTEAPKTGVINISHWIIPVAYWDACACRRMIETNGKLIGGQKATRGEKEPKGSKDRTEQDQVLALPG